jgi:hypothetical protein
MNKELLKRFQLEAGGSHYPDINPKIQEQFAELIVRECADLVKHVAKQGGGTYGEVILTHFGLKP